MPRTPQPASVDKTPWLLALSELNDNYINQQSEELGVGFSEVFNSELDFVRFLGLPKLQAARLFAAAAAISLTPHQFVREVLADVARKLPVTSGKAPVHGGKSTRRSLTVTGPNQAYVLHYAQQNGLDRGETVDRLLLFCQTYDLLPGQIEGLRSLAASKGVSLRELAASIIADRVASLPEADVSRVLEHTGASTVPGVEIKKQKPKRPPETHKKTK